MLRRLQNTVIQALLNRSFATNDEIFLHLISLTATVFCGCIHLYLLILFSFFKLGIFIVMNVLSVALYVALTYLVRKRRYTIAGLLVSCEVSAYAFTTGYLLGIDNYIISYYILVIIMQIIVPYGKSKMRVIVAGMVFLTLMASITIHILKEPLIVLPVFQQHVLMISNILILLGGTLIQLFIGNLVKGVINELQNIRVKELEDQVNTDPLTGLLNRRYASVFFDKISILEENLYSVAMIDIDDFKQINDTYGHAKGDIVLRFIADFLKTNLRKNDLIFRWGGEEFLLILGQIEPERAFHVMKKICRRLEETDIALGDEIIRITVTVGIVKLDIQDPLMSINQSDEKMYQGKRSGKNTVEY